MDLRKLKTLIDLVQQSGIAELEITEGEEKVRISRGTTGIAVAPAGAPPAAVYLTGAPAQAAVEATAAAAAAATGYDHRRDQERRRADAGGRRLQFGALVL